MCEQPAPTSITLWTAWILVAPEMGHRSPEAALNGAAITGESTAMPMPTLPRSRSLLLIAATYAVLVTAIILTSLIVPVSF